jgi:alanyl-tRNA synthetase
VQCLAGNGLTASDWVKSVTAIIGGKGGGNETNAQGSGINVDKLSEALEAAKQYASSRVKTQ